MKAIIFFLTAALTCTVALAQNSGPLDFLEADKDYVIQFREDTNLFEQSYVDKTADAADKAIKRGPAPIFHVVKVSNGSWAYLEYPADAADYAKWNAKREEVSPLTKVILENQKQDAKQLMIIHELEREIRLVGKSVGGPPSTRDRHLKQLQDVLDAQKRDSEQSIKSSNAILERRAAFNKELAREVSVTKTWVNLEHAVSITEAFTEAKLTAKATLPASIDFGKLPSPDARSVLSF